MEEDRDVWVECLGCGGRFDVTQPHYRCPKCGDLLEIDRRLDRMDYGGLRKAFDARPLGVWRYRELLSPAGSRRLVTMAEGGTPLLPAKRLAEKVGIRRLWVKCEGVNPTGSFKDRGMAVGVAAALELGARRVVCASTGNTSASLAAYAALAGLPCLIVIPEGKVALGKLAQAMVHGATVVGIQGSFDDAMALVLKAADQLGLYLLNSMNPFRLEGQKTGGYEVFDQLGGRSPDWVVLPMGNGNNIAAYWKAFTDLRGLGALRDLPRMAGVQAQGASPIASAVAKGLRTVEPVPNPETVATAIRIGRPANWRKTLRAIYDSRGTALAVPDDEIIEAQRAMASLEGLFVEPASAASLAGLRHLVEGGTVDRGDEVVLVATGHGLKDPEGALRATGKPRLIPPDVEALRAVVEVGA
jgi:threonine synthase